MILVSAVSLTEMILVSAVSLTEMILVSVPWNPGAGQLKLVERGDVNELAKVGFWTVLRGERVGW